MAKFQSWIIRVSISGTALFLLGEDVERRPIEVHPPDQSGKPAGIQPKDSLDSDRFGQDTRIITPTRLKLNLPVSLNLPDQPKDKALSEAERISKRIDDYLLSQAAIRRVQTGSINPGWHNVSRRIERYLQPQFDQVNDPTTEVSWAWMRKIVWDWLDNWYRSAGTQSDNRTHLSRIDPQYLTDTAMLKLARAAVHDPEYGTTITSLVEIRFQKNGTLSAKLLGSSGHKKFDREALQAAKKAIQAPMKQELPEEHGRALYAVSARYAILPPLPVVGFGFDIMSGYAELLYPCKKMVSGRADLLAVFR